MFAHNTAFDPVESTSELRGVAMVVVLAAMVAIALPSGMDIPLVYLHLNTYSHIDKGSLTNVPRTTDIYTYLDVVPCRPPQTSKLAILQKFLLSP